MNDIQDTGSMDIDSILEQEDVKKPRSSSTSSADSMSSTDSVPVQRHLEFDGVKALFQEYDLMDSDAVSCFICGKHYKSKVCVKKHLWEHSIYWEMFDGLKKQQRVLSIQAGIILAIRTNPSLQLLLVTSPGGSKKKEKMARNSKQKMEPASPKKRKRSFDSTSSSCSVSSPPRDLEFADQWMAA